MKQCNYCKTEHPKTTEYWSIRPRQMECKQQIRDRATAWRLNNQDRKKAYDAKYDTSPLRKKKKSIAATLSNARRRKLYPEVRASHAIRKRLQRVLRHNKHQVTVIKALGCTLQFFKNYISGQFVSGMSWDNYGSVWHLDHILPLANYDLTDRATYRRLCHYTNYQPLFALDNIRKSNKED